MVQPYKAGPFLGINNRLPVEKLRAQFPLRGMYVRDAVNVDLTDSGSFQRRPGVTLVQVASRGRSLWSHAGIGYYADGPNLMKFDGEDTTTLASLQDPQASVSFTNTPRGIVWTDGRALELLEGDTSRSLAIPAPNPIPSITVLSNGSMPAGDYLIAFADTDVAGERSVLTPYIALDVPEGGAIELALPAGRTRDTQVYVSACGGAVLYHEATVPAGDTAARLSAVLSSGADITDEVEVPMPAGTSVRYHYGRLLTVQDNAIFYSQPFAYGVHRPAKGYVLLDGPVTLCEPVDGGVYLATAKQSWFASGNDIAAAELVDLGPFGATANTAISEPNSTSIWWFGPRGAVKGDSNGKVELKQDANIAFGVGTTGAALFREENGFSQVIVSVANATPATAARN